MPTSYNEFFQQLSVGTITQNIGFYSLIGFMFLVILFQRSVLDKRKNNN